MSGYGNRGGRGGNGAEEYMMQSMMIKMTMSINKQCFNECINSFSDSKLTQSETNCISSCAKRHSGAFMAMNDIQGEMASKSQGGMF
ncbi:UNKNOWN [Stylonychia lemnae]|uniref:Mitochondrial import inner membrane translocase subunit n=1 Tax=Stylonychia lemnae TaxID=5949 RepID=A0A078AEF4_STYLE|nr:UNKNOWN [Stylonychia lemnae]|eukprot:CDW79298.1 UNKNOWN [Stylonychia lemnae]